jgi:hypothetical protein
MWMKWHHKWATGERAYEWLELRCAPEQASEVAQETAQELGSHYRYANTYRGVGFELFEVPPIEVIQANLLQAEKALLGYQRRVQELQELLKKVTT